jgi:DDE superfamily endonuclease/Helix-turn-helix of DDE superfamily endonuclease
MYATTGFTASEIADLAAMVYALQLEKKLKKEWPRILGLSASIVVTLTYLRRNRVQQELAETYGVSQPTISRAIAALTPALGQVLADYVPTVDELDPQTPYVVDGTLVPCWSWASRKELYSGKHKTTGMNLQIACTLSGRLDWISDPIDGRRNDTYCLRESGMLDVVDPSQTFGDKGYVGNNMVTPVKKPIRGKLSTGDEKFNTQVNKIRYVIEQVIANFKTWRIMHTDYRRPLNTFTETISTVIALHFYKLR